MKSASVEILFLHYVRLKIFQTVKHMKIKFLKTSGKVNSLSDICHSTI